MIAPALTSLHSSCLVLIETTIPMEESILAFSMTNAPNRVHAIASPSFQHWLSTGPSSAINSCVPQTIISPISLSL